MLDNILYQAKQFSFCLYQTMCFDIAHNIVNKNNFTRNDLDVIKNDGRKSRRPRALVEE